DIANETAVFAFRLIASGPDTVTSIRVTFTGDINDTDELNAVLLYEDINQNFGIDGGDTLIASLSWDSTNLAWLNTAPIAISGTADSVCLAVSANVKSTAPDGDTFQVRINAGDVVADSGGSAPTVAAINTAVYTIQVDTAFASIASTANITIDADIAANETGVLPIVVSTSGPDTINGITVSFLHDLVDTASFSQVSLYRDVDQNSAFSSGDTFITNFAYDSTNVDWDVENLNIGQAGYGDSYWFIVTAQLETSVTDGETFQIRLNSGGVNTTQGGPTPAANALNSAIFSIEIDTAQAVVALAGNAVINQDVANEDGVLPFVITTSGADTINSITISFSGPLVDTGAFSAVRLYADSNQNDQLDTNDGFLTNFAYDSTNNDWDVTNLGRALAGYGDSFHGIVSVSVKSSVLDGETFQVQLDSGGVNMAQGGLVPDTDAQNSALFSIEIDTANVVVPATAGTILDDDIPTETGVLPFSITASALDSATSMTISFSGTIVDSEAFASVKLYEDANNNSQLDNIDTLVATFAYDSTNSDWGAANLGLGVNGLSDSFFGIVAVTLSSSAGEGDTFQVQLDSAGMTMVQGGTIPVPAAPNTAIYTVSLDTVEATTNLFIPGVIDNTVTNETLILPVNLTTSGIDTISAITLNLQGSMIDTTKISFIKVYYDSNTNLLFDLGTDPLLGTFVSSGGGTWTVTGLNIDFEFSGDSWDILITASIETTASAGDTLQVTIPVGGITTDFTDTSPTIAVIGPMVSLGNVAPVANAGPDSTIANPATYLLNGSASSDANGDTITYLWGLNAGPSSPIIDSATQTLSTVTLDSTGTYTFILTVDDGTDSTTDTVSITVTNVIPVAIAGPDTTFPSVDTAVLDASGSYDPDSDVIFFSWILLSGPSSPTPVNANVSVTTVFLDTSGNYIWQVAVSDNTDTGIDAIVFAVNNVPPVSNAGSDTTIPSAGGIVLNGSASSDPNGDTLTYTWTKVSGPQATVDSPTAAITTATVDSAGTYVFNLEVNDGSDTNADTIQVVILNTPPVADAGTDSNFLIPGPIAVSGTASYDPDGGTTLSYSWSKTSGPAGSFDSPASSTPIFTPTMAGTYVLRLDFSDGTDTNFDNVVFSINNTPPFANAGLDTNLPTTGTYVLVGTYADSDGDTITSFFWQKTSGPGPSQSGASPNMTAILDSVGIYVFTFFISDGVDFGTDTVTIAVANAPPISNAGTDTTINLPDTLILNGSGSSDGNGDTLTYTWSQIAGTTVATIVSPATESSPVFLPGVGTYTFQLFVTDGLDTSIDTVVFTLLNNVPIANAGADSTFHPASNADYVYTLDASASTDADSTSLSYAWTQLSGPSVTIDSPTSVQSTVTLKDDSTYVFSVSVSDSLNTVTDTVAITVTNNVPSVNAGSDSSVHAPDTFLLDGSSTVDADGDLITFTWTQISGGTVAISSPNTSSTNIYIAIPGVYQFRLTVSDNEDTVFDDVQFSAVNNVPYADAGPDTPLNVPDTITATAAGSTDLDGDTLAYTWTKLSGPAATITSPTAQVTPIVLTSYGTFVFQVAVTDGFDTATDSMTAVVINAAPIANAGTDTTIQKPDTLILNGTLSFDSDANALTFLWTKTSGPAITISNATSGTAQVAPTTTGVYIFNLAVGDGFDTGNDTVTITKLALASLEVTISSTSPTSDSIAVKGAEQTLLLAFSVQGDTDGDTLSEFAVTLQGNAYTTGVDTIAIYKDGNEDAQFTAVFDPLLATLTNQGGGVF
ncbi:MAG: hypothetical protein JKX85_03205, partial [Phycisphaeraceae bacterium]|nr:hypothetical protein [Phycisphaeraceae bacterium]